MFYLWYVYNVVDIVLIFERVRLLVLRYDILLKIRIRLKLISKLIRFLIQANSLLSQVLCHWNHHGWVTIDSKRRGHRDQREKIHRRHNVVSRACWITTNDDDKINGCHLEHEL